MTRQELDDKAAEWLKAVGEMKRLGVITKGEYTVQQRNIKAWWYDRKKELENTSLYMELVYGEGRINLPREEEA